MPVADAALILGRKMGTLQAWKNGGRFKPKAFLTNRRGAKKPLYDLEEIRKVNEVLVDPRFMQPPEGYLTSSEAGGIMDRSGASVCTMFRKGKLQGISVVTGRSKPRVFILKTSAEEFAAAEMEAARGKFVSVSEHDLRYTVTNEPLDIVYEKPLIADNHAVCLDARRKLWEENNRVWPKNLVERGRQVG